MILMISLTEATTVKAIEQRFCDGDLKLELSPSCPIPTKLKLRVYTENSSQDSSSGFFNSFQQSNRLSLSAQPLSLFYTCLDYHLPTHITHNVEVSGLNIECRVESGIHFEG